jgi:phage repressor protein C with HTH and peptisase S24 domain
VSRIGLAVVHGRSMEPTLHEGDRLLVQYAARPRAGRLAVVRLPDDDAGQPRPVAVKRLSRPDADGWWVERDNPAEGVDSWLIGVVPSADVIALVLGRVWPHPSRLRGTAADAGPGLRG